MELRRQGTRLLKAGECARCSEAVREARHWSAMEWLLPFRNDPVAMLSLRSLLAATGSHFVDQFGDEATLDEIANRIAAGSLHICSHEEGYDHAGRQWSSGPGGGSVSQGNGSGQGKGASATVEAPRAAAAGARKPVDLNKVKRATWLAIQLVDMEGNPVPGQKYEVRRSGKVIKAGKLDGTGFARLDDLEPDGNYEVSFLDLDQEAWQPAGRG